MLFQIAIELLSPSVVPGAKMDMKVLAAPFSHVALLALDSGLNVLNKAGLSRDGVCLIASRRNVHFTETEIIRCSLSFVLTTCTVNHLEQLLVICLRYRFS